MEPEFSDSIKIPRLNDAVKYLSTACVIYLPRMLYFNFMLLECQKSNHCC